jgi:hypothetical protein
MNAHRLIAVLILLAAIPLAASSQVDTAWIRYYDGPGHSIDVARAIAIDVQDNVYVTGESMDGAGNYDYATVAYGPNGDTLWVRRFNGVADNSDYAKKVVVDQYGNTYVGGSSITDIDCGYDFVTVKYSPLGSPLWTTRYNGIGGYSAEMFADMALDAFGNMLVTGYSNSSQQSDPNDDFAVVKYSSSGVALDTVRGGAQNFSPTSLACDNTGSFVVTGAAIYNGGQYFVSFGFDGSGYTTGPVWHFSTAHNVNVGRAITVDALSNFYATGRVYENSTAYFTTIKYAPNGTEQWATHCNGPDGTSGEPYALVVDGQGRVFATGRNWRGTLDQHIFTAAYAPNGDTLWTAYYDEDTGDETALGIALDNRGSVIVAGYDCINRYNTDIVAVAYGIDGQRKWVYTYNGESNSHDYGFAVAVDHKGNVYVAGQATRPGTGQDFILIKLVPSAGAADDANAQLPTTVALEQNYPNPFNPTTTISYTLAGSRENGVGSTETKLVVHDLLGREVAVLVNEKKAPGSYEVKFDGSALSSGVYFYSLKAGSSVETKKLMLLR